jgi:hypothetical protein
MPPSQRVNRSIRQYWEKKRVGSHRLKWNAFGGPTVSVDNGDDNAWSLMNSLQHSRAVCQQLHKSGPHRNAVSLPVAQVTILAPPLVAAPSVNNAHHCIIDMTNSISSSPDDDDLQVYIDELKTWGQKYTLLAQKHGTFLY